MKSVSFEEGIVLIAIVPNAIFLMQEWATFDKK